MTDTIQHHAVPVRPRRGVSRPVGADEVTLTDGFWHTRQRLNTERLLDHADRWIESMGWYDAFRVAAGGERTIPMQGKLFTDADVYKLLEGFAWELASRPDAEREARFGELAALIADAQEDDGYLNTFFGPKGAEHRYEDLAHGHELYCAGHLFQAAVARLRAGADDDLAAVAIRLADRICDDFGEGGISGSDGHPEIEVGLMELYRATGESRYLEQARRFVEWRGGRRFEHHAIGDEYYVDDMPVREATVLRGHVVRATYFAAGALDLAVETGDDELFAAVERQWRTTWARRTYITGGMGARHLGESFGDDFELPPDRAYTETCGAVGAIMVAWRLLLATGEAEYADAIERLLFNMIATHPNADGDRVFYVNPLLRREPGIEVPEGEAPFRKDTLRANWFWVACCPTNVTRLLASLSGYFTTVEDDALTLQQFFTGEVTTELADGRAVAIDVRTDYPWDGRVTATVTAGSGEWTLRLRVPGWADGATLSTGDEETPVSVGYASVTRVWRPGDSVVLTLPLETRVSVPDPRINALRDTVAIERGPLVYCAESPVGEDGQVDLDAFTWSPDAALRTVPLTGVSDARWAVRIEGRASAVPAPASWPYGAPLPRGAAGTAALDLVPYYAWSNRGPSTMRVWLPTHDPSSEPGYVTSTIRSTDERQRP